MWFVAGTAAIVAGMWWVMTRLEEEGRPDRRDPNRAGPAYPSRSATMPPITPRYAVPFGAIAIPA